MISRKIVDFCHNSSVPKGQRQTVTGNMSVSSQTQTENNKIKGRRKERNNSERWHKLDSLPSRVRPRYHPSVSWPLITSRYQPTTAALSEKRERGRERRRGRGDERKDLVEAVPQEVRLPWSCFTGRMHRYQGVKEKGLFLTATHRNKHTHAQADLCPPMHCGFQVVIRRRVP